jgi:hypothetical protein
MNEYFIIIFFFAGQLNKHLASIAPAPKLHGSHTFTVEALRSKSEVPCIYLSNFVEQTEK